MELNKIKQLLNELVEIRIKVAKLNNNILYKHDILSSLDNAIDNLKIQEKDEVYRLYLIQERKENE